jgi:hypothetical protein
MGTAVLLVFSLAGYSSEINGQSDLLSVLRQKDPALNEGAYAVSFTMAGQANLDDPNQGMVFMDCRAMHTELVTLAMKITYRYEKDPVFVRPGSRGYEPGDYYKGQLVVWRSVEKYVLSSPMRNTAIERLRYSRIDRNNRVASSSETNMCFYWPVGVDDSTRQFRQFQLSVGRGYSKHLTHAVSTELSGGLIRTTVDGSYGSEGSWELSVDPNSDYLVRGAFYRFKGQELPSVITRNSGLLSKGNIRIAKYGTFQSPVLRLSTEATNIETEPSEIRRFLDEVTAALDSPLPVGTSILDFRSGQPVRTRVK